MNSQPLEDLHTFVLNATNNEYAELTQQQWVLWIELVDQTAREGYSIKSVTHTLPTDEVMAYVAIGQATATQLRDMRETLREIRENHRAGHVSIGIVDDLDEPI